MSWSGSRYISSDFVNRVRVQLKEHMNTHGIAHVSQPTLARELGVSYPSVNAAMKSMIATGELTKHGHGEYSLGNREQGTVIGNREQSPLDGPPSPSPDPSLIPPYNPPRDLQATLDLISSQLEEVIVLVHRLVVRGGGSGGNPTSTEVHNEEEQYDDDTPGSDERDAEPDQRGAEHEHPTPLSSGDVARGRRDSAGALLPPLPDYALGSSARDVSRGVRITSPILEVHRSQWTTGPFTGMEMDGMGITKRPLKPTPDEYEIKPWHFAFADRMGLDQAELMYETEQFLDHHRSKGNRFADWDAAWRTWMRNTQKYGTRQKQRPAGWRAQAMQQSFQAMDRFVHNMTQEGYDVGGTQCAHSEAFGIGVPIEVRRAAIRMAGSGRGADDHGLVQAPRISAG